MRLVWGAPEADLCERDDSWVVGSLVRGGYFLCVEASMFFTG